MHLSFATRGSTPGIHPETKSEPRGNGTIVAFSFSPRRRGVVVGKHGDIPARFVRGSVTGRVKSASPGTMVDVRK